MASGEVTRRAWRALCPCLVIASVSGLAGCVLVDSYHRSWTVRDLTTASDAASPVAQLELGMTQAEVLGLVGERGVQQRSAEHWRLVDQFTPFKPGLYPYVDTRQVELHFDREARLAAIREHGAYNQYP